MIWVTVLVKDNHEVVIMMWDAVSSLKTINKQVYTDHKVFYAYINVVFFPSEALTNSNSRITCKQQV